MKQNQKAGQRLIRRAAAIAAVAMATILLASCAPTSYPVTADGTPSSPIGRQTFKEPTTNRTYHLYVPTTYDATRQYPLIVTAQGTFPFDTSSGQRDSWVEVAEKNNLIICSPDFDSATGLLGIPKDKPAPELLRDETAVLAIVAEVRSHYNINPDGILITGWSGGGFPAHFIGLRNPDIFRAIVGRTANFSEYLVSDETARRARHMHVFVFFGTSEFAGIESQNRTANFWYTIHGFANFQIKQVVGGHARNNRRTAEWFLNILGTYPTAHIKASTTSGKAPLEVHFEAIAHDPDGRVQTTIFQFGDGAVSIKPDVIHTYHKPGTYNVVLTVVDNDNHRQYAQMEIVVE